MNPDTILTVGLVAIAAPFFGLGVALVISWGLEWYARRRPVPPIVGHREEDWR